jgi:hypothetical protein
VVLGLELGERAPVPADRRRHGPLWCHTPSVGWVVLVFEVLLAGVKAGW